MKIKKDVVKMLEELSISDLERQEAEHLAHVQLIQSLIRAKKKEKGERE